ncbi:uncharacterized protein EV422DRAFT_180544 [Fimicolochytrium jonesii]|uniref:uncharacterized protein n=1 Tax=Fimicolochytrium jonesii TaxID=1396493 RepID=UPI0022FF45EE|nr:uncharacterized protein EV422DRAFT_180544 [Fimicolochytrium jonesii]KAI8818334.1 hypothetical protein EV422DRAFT_180544 [Fimicolochytrium jonesii]
MTCKEVRQIELPVNGMTRTVCIQRTATETDTETLSRKPPTDTTTAAPPTPGKRSKRKLPWSLSTLEGAKKVKAEPAEASVFHEPDEIPRVKAESGLDPMDVDIKHEEFFIKHELIKNGQRSLDAWVKPEVKTELKPAPDPNFWEHILHFDDPAPPPGLAAQQQPRPALPILYHQTDDECLEAARKYLQPFIEEAAAAAAALAESQPHPSDGERDQPQRGRRRARVKPRRGGGRGRVVEEDEGDVRLGMDAEFWGGLRGFNEGVGKVVDASISETGNDVDTRPAVSAYTRTSSQSRLTPVLPIQPSSDSDATTDDEALPPPHSHPRPRTASHQPIASVSLSGSQSQAQRPTHATQSYSQSYSESQPRTQTQRSMLLGDDESGTEDEDEDEDDGRGGAKGAAPVGIRAGTSGRLGAGELQPPAPTTQFGASRTSTAHIHRAPQPPIPATTIRPAASTPPLTATAIAPSVSTPTFPSSSSSLSQPRKNIDDILDDLFF